MVRVTIRPTNRYVTPGTRIAPHSSTNDKVQLVVSVIFAILMILIIIINTM